MAPHSWLLLLYGLPTGRKAERISLWRKLKKFGALALKTSAYLLPDEPAHFERFQWFAKQVRDGGGDATLIRVAQIEGLSNEALAQMFSDARAADYRALSESITRCLGKRTKRARAGLADALEGFNQRFHEIRAIDYFDCATAHDAQMLLNRATGLLEPKAAPGTRLDAKRFRGQTWLTRPRPEIDRVGSAWLIRRLIDPEAKFVFAAKPREHPDAIPYDMVDVEFTHHGEDCTFETLVRRFGLGDARVRQIAEMVHEADLEDGKFQRHECLGLDRVFKGWARLGLSDAEILERGLGCFEALYASLK